MNEKEIEIHEVDPLDLFGVNEKKLTKIKSYFPKVKIIARGNKLKVLGQSKDIISFEEKLMILIEHLKKYKQLTENNIERVLSSESENELLLHDNEILVFGNSGLVIKPKTKNQRELVKKMADNDMVFAIGPAGTGKTYTAVALAVRALKNKTVRRIILTRPAVEAGEHLGFLPGDLKEKL
ncbi:MAG TPA: phosphate starvation-inducible protein PhoH, partial [Flavobacteriales bacterium]|nr:phosphate starvation-inducible protein PhoH [Flavobacteriales bacterium]